MATTSHWRVTVNAAGTTAREWSTTNNSANMPTGEELRGDYNAIHELLSSKGFHVAVGPLPPEGVTEVWIK